MSRLKAAFPLLAGAARKFGAASGQRCVMDCGGRAQRRHPLSHARKTNESANLSSAQKRRGASLPAALQRRWRVIRNRLAISFFRYTKLRIMCGDVPDQCIQP